ncbi:Dihydrofolate reductase [Buchnera aphidicola (Chaitophorus populicola)]|uniref:dihydrofolate reductase n=1 Tax=Buchnera aphidicola TaxID=9 RepID=UPI003464AF12
MISIIAAISQNYVISQKNKIPWNISKDLLWFKKHTINKVIIMGRNTWNTIKIPLPMRKHIILSKKKHKSIHLNKKYPIKWAKSIQDAIKLSKSYSEKMIIGGGEIYSQFLPITTKLYLTHVKKIIPGDVFFPKYKNYKWKKIYQTKNFIDKKSNLIYFHEILEKM